MFNGSINPGQLEHRSHDPELSNRSSRQRWDRPMSIGRCSPVRGPSTTSASMPTEPSTVAHTGGLATDGTDTIRNVEILDFTDQDISLVAPTLDLHGDVTNTTTVTAAQAYRDTFDTAAHNNSNGTVPWGATPLRWRATMDGDRQHRHWWANPTRDNGKGNELRFTAAPSRRVDHYVPSIFAGATTATLSFRLRSGEQR